MPMTIERIERDEEKEGHNGRITSRHWVIWMVIQNDECIREYTTKREAVAYIKSKEAK